MRSHKILRANGTESRRSVLNFPVNQRLLYALATGDIGPLSWALQQTAKKPNAAQWVLRYGHSPSEDSISALRPVSDTLSDPFGAARPRSSRTRLRPSGTTPR